MWHHFLDYKDASSLLFTSSVEQDEFFIVTLLKVKKKEKILW